jgi:hypothetical protein
LTRVTTCCVDVDIDADVDVDVVAALVSRDDEKSGMRRVSGTRERNLPFFLLCF